MKATWYFDFISPFAYLQLKDFGRLPADLDVEYVPVLFAGLLNHWGQLGPAEIPAKRLQTYRFCHWQAHRLGVPFRMPAVHPFHPLTALRLCLALGPNRANVETIFDSIWGDGRDFNDPETANEVGTVLGVEDVARACENADVKQALHANTQKAIDHGVYGVPTFEVAGELFWGADLMDMMLDFLAEPRLFDHEEMQRIAKTQVGAERPRGNG